MEERGRGVLLAAQKPEVVVREGEGTAIVGAGERIPQLQGVESWSTLRTSRSDPE